MLDDSLALQPYIYFLNALDRSKDNEDLKNLNDVQPMF